MRSNFITFCVLLIAEITIAIFEFHPIVRGFVGDMLAVPLVYFLIRMIFKISSEKAIFLSVSIAFGIELLQWLHVVEHLGITWKPVKIILGTSFDPYDLLAYLIGGLLLFLPRNKFSKYLKNE